MINKIAFKNYKLFKEKQSIELRPITVIIGKNNSGKSAVAKLPTLISGSLSGTFTAPLQLENEGVRIGNSYEDLFYNREITVAPLEFEIADDKESLKVSITGDNSYSIKISKFNYNNLGFLDISKAKFNGFVTKKHKSKALNLNFDYIESFRKFPDETFSDIFGEYSKLGISGENAYKLLAKYYKTSDKVLDLVSNWFEKNFEGWKLSVKDIAGSSVSYEVVLENKSIKRMHPVK